MNDLNENENSPTFISNRKMTREEIIKAVTEPGSAPETQKKYVVIPSLESEKANFKEIVEGLNVQPDSKRYQILKKFCEGTNASMVDIKALIQRIENLSAAQLNILELICERRTFTAKNILETIQSIKKIGSDRLLALRAFVDIDGLAPGPLNRFFLAILPQGSLKDLGKDGWENELKEKAISSDQVTVFYNICSGISGMTHGAAITALPKIRQLRPQHSQLINCFFKKGVVFGKKNLTTDNIVSLINLFSTLPELNDPKRMHKLIKKLSRQPEDKKKDFQFLIHAFKDEIENEKGKGGNKFVSGIRDFFN